MNIDEKKTTVKDRGVLDMLDLSIIKRWNIVDVHRQQSVAEHSFRVGILADDLYDALMPTEHNSFDKNAIQLLARVHDMDELYQGDPPSTLKDVMESIRPGISREIRNKILADNLPFVLTKIRGYENTFPYYVVKIADEMEGYLFCRRYAVDPDHRQRILDRIKTRVNHLIHEGSQKFPSIRWPHALQWVHELISLSRFAD